MTENYTALYEEHKKLGASFTDFGGWQMPLKYSSELAEHHAVRKAAGLFDLSHMGEVWVTGPDAAAFLDYALVGKISAMAVGKAKYSLICNEDGGIIDDLITYRRPAATTAQTRFLVVPNAGNAEVVAAALAERAAGFDVVVDDVSAETSLIAVQGPKARGHPAAPGPRGPARAGHGAEVLRRRRGPVPGGRRRTGPAAGPHRLHRRGRLRDLRGQRRRRRPCGRRCVAIADDGELTPGRAGLAATRSASRPACRSTATSSPCEGDPFAAGLGPVVALSKEGDFVGKAALAAKKEAGAGSTTGRKLVGLKGLGRRAGRGHYPVLKDGNVVGEVTSGQPSPTLGYPVAMAYVDVEYTDPAPPWTSTSAARRSRSKSWPCRSTSAQSSPLVPPNCGARHPPLRGWLPGRLRTETRTLLSYPRARVGRTEPSIGISAGPTPGRCYVDLPEVGATARGDLRGGSTKSGLGPVRPVTGEVTEISPSW